MDTHLKLNRVAIKNLSGYELVKFCDFLKREDEMNDYEFLIDTLRKRLIKDSRDYRMKDLLP